MATIKERKRRVGTAALAKPFVGEDIMEGRETEGGELEMTDQMRHLETKDNLHH